MKKMGSILFNLNDYMINYLMNYFNLINKKRNG